MKDQTEGKTMKRFEDLTTREKAELTDETFGRYASIAMMESEVVPADDPGEFVSEQLPPDEFVTMYAVTFGRYGNMELCFDTSEQAQTFIDSSPRTAEFDYQSGIYTFRPSQEAPAWKAVRMLSASSAIRHRERGAKEKERKDAHEKQRKEYDAFCAHRLEVIKPMQSEVFRASQVERDVMRIGTALKEYVDLCDGNEELARKFLAKKYTTEQIEQFDTW